MPRAEQAAVGQKQADRSWGRFDLRPAPVEEASPKHHPPVPTDEFEKNELLNMEKDARLYVTEHPLQGVRDQLRRKTDATIGELNTPRREDHDRRHRPLASHMTTKRGDLMVFLRIEDVTGGIETVVFN